jgi:hypothetical protein
MSSTIAVIQVALSAS